MEKELRGSDILLNLKEINISNINLSSSAFCSGKANFVIETNTKHGSCEDPDFTGKIEVLESKKDKANDTYVLKVRFTSEPD